MLGAVVSLWLGLLVVAAHRTLRQGRYATGLVSALLPAGGLSTVGWWAYESVTPDTPVGIPRRTRA